ncbi:YagK/YfjJ domain-containing protein [Lampropedia aestuarii]|uniref:YagK/YfjJ domain-containing protein n=1 Tax=Lampropedia aestuarii TaxID=2562762 RepID=UPI0024683AB9|nr:inovirus-type Gp2 protein [Lampropedia aestuarii]MDH5858817.1 inovirus-type Gp2 protein [Lampropedia aestuarii]
MIYIEEDKEEEKNEMLDDEEVNLHQVDQHFYFDANGCEQVYGNQLCVLEDVGPVFHYGGDTLLENNATMGAFIKLVNSMKNEKPLPLFSKNGLIPAKYSNLLSDMSQIVAFYDLFYNKVAFHPYVEAVMKLSPFLLSEIQFYQHLYPLHVVQARKFDSNAYAAINNVVYNYLAIVKSEAVRKRVDNIQRGVRENTASINSHFKALLSNHASLLVIRLDLSYMARQKDVGRLSHVTLEDIVKDKKDFLKAVEKKFQDFLGYVFKLEFGPKKGYHYHCILYFDGSKLRADGLVSQVLASIWKDVTQERRGVTFLCNLHKRDYIHLAIGSIHYSEKDKIKNFRYIAEYFSKNDLFSCVKRNGKRSLEKSQVKPKTSSRGRPRAIG